MKRIMLNIAVSALMLLAVDASAAAPKKDAVSVVGVVAVPAHYEGACPAALEFVGTLKLQKFPVTVEYLWQRSDGSRTQVRRIQARSARQKITDEWEIGGAPGRMEVWERLTILSPAQISSAIAEASVNCN